MDSVVSARGLGVRTKRGWVFRGVDLDVAPGELVAVTGAAGSGRTSLLLALGGYFRTTHGTLVRPGRAALGYVPRVTDPEPNLTVAEHLEERLILSGGAWWRRPRQRRSTAIDRLAVYFESPSTMGRDLTTLERHLLGLAQARVTDPDLILVDDTDPGLSTVEHDRLWAELRALADAGTAVVAACRDANRGSDNVITLERIR